MVGIVAVGGEEVVATVGSQEGREGRDDVVVVTVEREGQEGGGRAGVVAA
jgi:hypothetical protein